MTRQFKRLMGLAPRHQAYGFNLIEVLVSLLIVSIALSVLAPVLGLVFYRRVTSERVEVATRLAISEIDRIRALTDIQPIVFNVDDPPGLRTIPAGGGDLDPLNVLPPERVPANPGLGGLELQNSDTSIVQLFEIQGTGANRGNTQNYIIQTFRRGPGALNGEPCAPPLDDRPCAFEMIVRVYHRSSFDPAGDAYPELADPFYLSRTASALVSGSDSANSQIELRSRPLAVLRAEISQAASYRGICRLRATLEGDDPDVACANA